MGAHAPAEKLPIEVQPVEIAEKEQGNTSAEDSIPVLHIKGSEEESTSSNDGKRCDDATASKEDSTPTNRPKRRDNNADPTQTGETPADEPAPSEDGRGCDKDHVLAYHGTKCDERQTTPLNEMEFDKEPGAVNDGTKHGEEAIPPEDINERDAEHDTHQDANRYDDEKRPSDDLYNVGQLLKLKILADGGTNHGSVNSTMEVRIR